MSCTEAKTMRKRDEKGIAVLITSILLVLAIPMIGLAFDGTMLYIIKSRLQGAVDGAALAAARALSRGATGAAQIAAAQNEAIAYVNLNYQNGYFFSSNLNISTPTVDTSVSYQRTVKVTAQVTFPAFFLRILNVSSTTVAATASATRKDVNVMMVVDRSGSLASTNSCDPLKAAAVNFVNTFAPGRDNVGLITFASSTHVDFPLSTTFASANPDVATLINNITCAGSTSTAMALWNGYQQLAALNQPGALNVILLFTDGDPTGVTFHMPIANSSTCTAYTHGSLPLSAPDHYTMPAAGKGYLQGVYNTYTNISEFFGFLLETNNGTVTNGDINPANNSTGCYYYQGWPNPSNMQSSADFLGVPVTDIYGNSANTSYQPVTTNSYGFIDITNDANAQPMALNAADSAATRIRNGVTDPITGKSLSNIIIFSIGLGNAPYPFSPTFLERVSNDPRSPIYDSSKPAGAYIYAATTADLQPAFQEVASDILRLAR